ncbi:MAG: FtsX-like permease family protein [Lachnospiraceae bacterium]|nr:FtsX-like permease family protein [Lachnospiraceae bacterium]
MTNFFYARLAASNIKKNRQIYFPYIITCIITIAFYYIMKSLSLNDGLDSLYGGGTIRITLGLGCNVVMIFAVIFLFYTNSFLMKRREKEFGLFHILGMEKKHLMRVTGMETLYIAILGLGFGFLFGIVLDKVMFLLILRVLGREVSLGFHISGEVISSTAILFLGIFLLIFLNTARRLGFSKPIELLKSGNVGEKEPKANWLLAILGALSLGAGYYLAVTVQNPVAAITIFFVAVILVIVGTYLLFTAGSIVLLKILRANKRYYYKTRHFIGISGMLYRMKQNAVGLSNICILSTMVLVMISSTSALMIGSDDLISSRYPYDFIFYSEEENYGETDYSDREAIIDQALENNGLTEKESVRLRTLEFTAIKENNKFSIMEIDIESFINDFEVLAFITLDDYNRATGENRTLNDDEVLVCSNRVKIKSDMFILDDFQFKIVEEMKSFEYVGGGALASNIASSHIIVVKSPEILNEVYEYQKEQFKDMADGIDYLYGIRVDGEEEAALKAYEEIRNGLNNLEVPEGEVIGRIESKAEGAQSFYDVYSGLFFIGIFLGLLFTVAMILLIYYKQITEGYYDRDRYVIMQNVGMSQKDVKASIHSQILTVFFLPLITAGIHLIFAYPIVEKILAILNLSNTRLYVYCTIGCFAVFSLLYVAVYGWTAKLYYSIVKK